MLHHSTHASPYHPGAPSRSDSYRAAACYGGTDWDSLFPSRLGPKSREDIEFVPEHLLGSDADRWCTVCCSDVLYRRHASNFRRVSSCRFEALSHPTASSLDLSVTS
jgi:hypothetical protein